MSTDGLAPAGSSSYHSNTLNVGDGTWDKSRNDFLLPNLQGLNFATTRYNGMGNRFKGEPQYHTLVLGHSVVAAITFLFILPLALFLAKYGHDWPGGRVSFKLHIYLQIITVFLSTVVLVLGWFAVGPARSLTNPHHGIGVAIYVLILFQFLYGSCWFRRERRRVGAPSKLPLTVWLHRLLGRSTALLGIVEVALGLDLYGSPKYLFILYSLWGAFLLLLYLALDYYYMPRYDGTRPGRPPPEQYSDYGSSYVTNQGRRPPRKDEHHWGRDALAAVGLVGAYEWYKTRRDRRRQERDEKYGDVADGGFAPSSAPPGPPGQQPYGAPGDSMVGAGARRPQSRISRDSWEDDKYHRQQQNHTWRDRFLEATGAFAAYEGVRHFINKRRGREDDYSEDGGYGSALGGNRPMPSETDVSRVEAGHAPQSPATPRVNMNGAGPMTPTMTPSRPGATIGNAAVLGADSVSNDSRYGGGRPHPILEPGAPLGEHIRELGPIAGLREWNRQRKSRRDSDRADVIRRQELEHEESFNRRNSNNYPRPQDANTRMNSNSGTLLTGPNSDMSRVNTRPDTSHPPLPAGAGAYAANAGPGYPYPPPPPGPPPTSIRADGYNAQSGWGSAQMPQGAVTPDPARLLRDNTAANESSAYGRDPRIRDDVMGAAAAGAVGAVAAGALAERERQRHRAQSESPTRAQGSRFPRPSAAAASYNNVTAGPSSSRRNNPNSPPVSVQVQMHNDGRHVTLRRLNEEEAAASRESRRQDRQNRRGASLTSLGAEDTSTPPLGGQRYRRNGPVRRSSDQPITNVPPPPPMASATSFRRASEVNLPAPPAIQQYPAQQSSPFSNQGLSSPPYPPVGGSGSGGGGYGTDQGTDISAFESNRRRRRAERARRQEAEAARGVGERGAEFS